jgi:hypothetical protein
VGRETSPRLARSSGHAELATNLREEDSMNSDEKAFVSLLADSICESIMDTMGKDVLSILVSKGFLDDMANPIELDRSLSSTFGNASLMLERIIIKGLYQKLHIPYDSTFGFDYSKSLDIARDAFLEENRHE